MACSSKETRFHWFPALAHFEFEYKPTQPDGLYTYNMDTGKVTPLEMMGLEGEFFSHGMDFLQTSETDMTIMAINHKYAGSVVEIFSHKIGSTVLTHVETVVHDLITTPNSIVALSPTSFYATNDHANKSGILRLLEDFLAHPLTYLVYRDDKGHVSKALDGLIAANGVAMDKKRSLLYLNHVSIGTTAVYKRHSNGTLEQVKEHYTSYACDNVSVNQETGRVCLACFARPLQALVLFKNPDANSAATTLCSSEDGNDMVPMVVDGDGVTLRAATSAVYHKGHLLIGKLFGPTFTCKLD